jgi:hypothetical protein
MQIGAGRVSLALVVDNFNSASRIEYSAGAAHSSPQPDSNPRLMLLLKSKTRSLPSPDPHGKLMVRLSP